MALLGLLVLRLKPCEIDTWGCFSPNLQGVKIERRKEIPPPSLPAGRSRPAREECGCYTDLGTAQGLCSVASAPLADEAATPILKLFLEQGKKELSIHAYCKYVPHTAI